jgi:germination protein M
MPFRALAASALALVVLPAGCGSDDEQGAAPPGPPTTVESQPVATVPETAPAIVKVYFLREGKVQTASRGVVSGPQIGRAAMLELLEGPGTPELAAGLATDIPAGTRLESLTIEDGAAYVELSQSLSEEAAAQVVYTLTQFRTVQRVRLEGEEHLRTDFETETPAILVESPTAREEVSSPLRITGSANTFEATFNVEIVDERGRALGKRFVTATSGSGTRGTFDAEVPFKASAKGPGKLIVFELSAEDGSRIHEVEIPLQIEP